MKKILLLSLSICFQTAFSQVSMEKNQLVKDGTKYKFSQYEQVFQNAEARDYFKKARTNKTASEIFAYTGGFSLGLGIAEMIAQANTKTVYNMFGDPYKVKPDYSTAWTLIGTGVGLIGIGIPFALAADKNAKKAIQTENGESTVFQPYFKLESAGNGLALSYNF
ncbi:hypothetical protein QGN23_10315 [Chryseobacterium gotjawalense]|uniref:Uncharacterized protein n=1 Tax=Chryseobacterium gotjawalense TaxID=3042315 RepID=A0ABY8RAV7_9FLAO|nr:hypothetical protein [Chryseobacterium sp. wdc7]WHF50824.1 hypothetical protein QGN23_10315 [Chryseobacterium sp. wdc7]